MNKRIRQRGKKYCFPLWGYERLQTLLYSNIIKVKFPFLVNKIRYFSSYYLLIYINVDLNIYSSFYKLLIDVYFIFVKIIKSSIPMLAPFDVEGIHHLETYCSL